MRKRLSTGQRGRRFSHCRKVWLMNVKKICRIDGGGGGRGGGVGVGVGVGVGRKKERT